MHVGKYVFAQITLFLPQRHSRRILTKYDDRTKGRSFSHWSHMLVLMFGQLIGCGTLRELTDITNAKVHDINLMDWFTWQVELFVKWIKQHLQVKQFWGESENAVRILIHFSFH